MTKVNSWKYEIYAWCRAETVLTFQMSQSVLVCEKNELAANQVVAQVFNRLNDSIELHIVRWYTKIVSCSTAS